MAPSYSPLPISVLRKYTINFGAVVYSKDVVGVTSENVAWKIDSGSIPHTSGIPLWLLTRLKIQDPCQLRRKDAPEIEGNSKGDYIYGVVYSPEPRIPVLDCTMNLSEFRGATEWPSNWIAKDWELIRELQSHLIEKVLSYRGCK